MEILKGFLIPVNHLPFELAGQETSAPCIATLHRSQRTSLYLVTTIFLT